MCQLYGSMSNYPFAAGDKRSETLGAFSKPVGVYWKPIYNLLEQADIIS